MLSKITQHPIVSAIIVGIIGTVVGGLILRFLGYIDIFTILWKLLIIEITFPILVIIPLVLLSLYAIYLIYRKFKPSIRYGNYTSDNIFGIDWQWSYINGSIWGDHILPRCPNCRMILNHETQGLWSEMIRHEGYETTFECEGCEFTTTLEGRYNELIERLLRRIDQNIVTGNY